MSLFTPNTSCFTSYYDKAKYLLSWRISLLFTIVFSILVPIFIVNSSTALIPGGSALLISVGSLTYLHLSKNYSPLFWVYAISGTCIIHFAINTVHNFTHFVDFLWMSAIILLAFIGLGKRLGLIFIGIHLVGVYIFLFFNLNTHIETLKPKSTMEITGAFIEIVLALVAISYLLVQYINFNTYSEKQLIKANNELINKNEENKVLMKEIHHRVKNNLQIITSLLRLQKSDIPSSSQETFDQAISRIMTMSIIHKKLYQAEELSNIDTKIYLSELIDEIISSHSSIKKKKKEIAIHVENIGLKTIVPLGLLLNELISNSFKHAFTENIKGIVNIKISTTSENEFQFNYVDNGSWINNENTTNKFGTELIETLTEQLDGNYTRESSEYTFKLKNLDI